MNTEFLVEIKKFLIMAIGAYVVIIVSFLVYGVMKRKKHKQNLDQLYKAVANEQDGHVQYGKLLGYPILELSHKGARVRIFSHPRRRYVKANTTMEASMAGSTVADFVIYRKSMISVVAKTLGMQDIVVGEEEFDRLFIIQGKDSQAIKEFLNHDIRSQIKNIHLSHLMLKMQNNQFKMTTQKVLDTKEEYQPFYQAGISIIDYFVEEEEA